MTEIPTTEEFLKSKSHVESYQYYFISNLLVEFTKLHVQAALENAYKNSTCSNKPKFEGDVNYQVDEDSILNAYPENLIK